MKMRIGVLALQGSFAEHMESLHAAGAKPVPVKFPEQLDGVDALIIPGGESTTMRKLLNKYNVGIKIIDLAGKGLPIYGTCAGMIALAKHIGHPEQTILGLMDITVQRNAFGRQRESFEENLDIPLLGPESFRAVFIRAPLIKETGNEVTILARLNDGRVVAAEQDNLLVSSFHPELTVDLRMHQYFLAKVKNT